MVCTNMRPNVGRGNLRKIKGTRSRSATTFGAMRDIEVGLQQFRLARSEFRAYLVAKEELRWRVERFLPVGDRCRKAVARLVSDSSVSAFQSCADECACRFAESLPGGRFPGFESFIDVFYGNASHVETRTSEWAGQSPNPRACLTLKRNGATEKTCTPSLLDKSLLHALGRHAFAFMAATRQLPAFDPRWEAKAVAAHFGVFMVTEGNLIAEERCFAQKYAAASQVMDSTPLAPQDARMLLMCLRRKLGSDDAARTILLFVANVQRTVSRRNTRPPDHGCCRARAS